MEHGKPIAIKGVTTLAVLYVVLGLGYQVSFGIVLLMTVVLGAVSYIAGDLALLPKTNNIIATASDAVLSFLVIWLIGMAFGLPGAALAVPALIATAILGAFEFYYHLYIANKEIGMNSPSNSSWPKASHHIKD
ncbi:YndM family protein [Salipaludibacillus sp. CUR1]|uniref:YndM family protein n=1 Tax=Salipaludibacillus sp. CUR1 TaxID=2820003 RepID=UPI001E5204C9|nr:YndM family protein [Salipaludibacillus sp. CUR1]MCE7794415.1 YndM family protein [Salipaludibacillus sp. CUR1]